MFVDELTFHAKSGKGGNGVVRWLRLFAVAKGGPAGGDGGRGGDVYIEAVRNLSLLSKYTGDNKFSAENGEDGKGNNEFGKNGEDCVIKLPVGSKVTNLDTSESYYLNTEGERIRILRGGNGGYGNYHFKSPTNRTPMEAIPGQKAQEGTFFVELTLGVDVGLIGLPNAGKSTLLNAFTNATSAIGSYPFTTTEPHLGDLFGYVLADIPGLIEGAAEGKGLGHKFLRHASKARMLLHLISLENEDPVDVYRTIREELRKHNADFLQKEEWIILTKTDLRTEEEVAMLAARVREETGKPVFAVSVPLEEGTKGLQDTLVKRLRSGK